MAKRLVMNINNDSNLQALINWCNQYHIQYQVIDDNPLGLVDDKVSDSTPVKTRNTKTDKFPLIGDEKKYTIGDFITVYPTHKFVRTWETGNFCPDKVKYGIKTGLKESGATWNKEQGAYEFHTKKDFDAWVKAQKARSTTK